VAVTSRRSPQDASSIEARRLAKRLRAEMTEPERRLWWSLRHAIPLAGTHFRRQTPIGPYVADFCCLKARLIIEVDGGQHGSEEGKAHDLTRTRYFEAHGFRELRFWNHEVMREMPSVIETIFNALVATPPTPDPSPQGGGEGGEGRVPFPLAGKG
jgi:very-short-patch-repair endonuclease